MSTTQQADGVDGVDGVVFVTTEAASINNNNLQDPSLSPYHFLNHEDKEYKRPPPPNKSDCVCDLCFKRFTTFSSLFTHKSKLCYEDLTGEVTTPIKICFAPQHLVWIADTIAALHLQVATSADAKYSYVVVDESMVEITMRRFYVSQITKYNLEEWCPAVEQLGTTLRSERGFTPKTVFMSLSDEELKMIRGLCSVVLANNVGMNARETQKELTLREQLEDKINSTVFATPHTYFCKLSTRSPKDSISTKINEGDEGDALLQKMQAKMSALKVTNAEEVINLITRSQRIFSDISMYFQYRVIGSSSSTMSLIFREWMDMPQDREFRCFASNYTLHAISQYHCYTVFSSLQDTSEVRRVRDAILAFHDVVKAALPMPDYVMDVVVYADGTCQMIEVNPFGSYMSSGAGLFNWATDRAVLYGLDRPSDGRPTIRVLRQLIK